MRQLGCKRLIAVLGCLAVAAAPSAAQLTTRDAAAVLIFPKVIVDGSWDTTIQLSNNANRPAYAVCHYVNGAATFPDLPPGPDNPPLWTEADFPVFLVRQQPTHWVGSRGRTPSGTLDNRCTGPLDDCDATGLDPGRIPPIGPDFTGELLCVEVDASGAPWSGNALTGHATLTHLQTGEVIKVPALGARGFDSNDADGTLCLGGEPDERCPRGGEYEACARRWNLSHPAEFDDSPVDGYSSRTTLTVVPCGQDFELQEPTRLTLQMLATSEFETRFSSSTTVECWGEIALADFFIFDRDTLGSDWVYTRLQSPSPSPGFALVQQTIGAGGKPPTFTATATVGALGEPSEQPDLLVFPHEVDQ